MLGVVLPLFGTLANYYRLAIHPVDPKMMADPPSAIGMAMAGIGLLYGVYQVERAIMRQTAVVIRRGNEIEIALGNKGVFAAAQAKMATSLLQRLSGTILYGYLNRFIDVADSAYIGLTAAP
jgi:hypothetical protein